MTTWGISVRVGKAKASMEWYLSKSVDRSEIDIISIN